MLQTAVLMATYNGELFIQDQLDSIRNQTLRPDVVLIRDDGSTDGTVAVVEAYIQTYQLEGWKILRNEKNLGWRRNFRQLMLDVLDYPVDYIFFSDQDDTWYLDKNQVQVDQMERHPDMDLLSADIDIEVLGENATVPSNFVFADQEQVLSKYPQDFTYHNYRQGWTFCLRASYVRELMAAYPSDLIVSHDNLTAGVAGVLGTAYNLNRPVGLHKRHGGNASGNILNLHSSRQRHLDELYLVLSYYTILEGVIRTRQHETESKVQAYLQFNQKRYQYANGRKFLATFGQMLTQGSFYDSLSNRIRDAIFLFKK
ncbi:glycosyltransferase [Streptococcus sp. DD13]|uniref:glycosyltransferase n=1 Tax=Streptococcus sp. DD13 TaxID=1777881 RepID=UPI000798B6A9|nr:glycosyltransferase [Streptococcus sp. DD13]KXT79149.1 Glycosyl transferase, group 2 family protein [Streptococcus sp. DD13]